MIVDVTCYNIYFRYCEDYSLCSECEKTSTVIHDNKHLFLVIDHPTLYHPTQPLLTHNFYGYVKIYSCLVKMLLNSTPSSNHGFGASPAPCKPYFSANLKITG